MRREIEKSTIVFCLRNRANCRLLIGFRTFEMSERTGAHT